MPADSEQKAERDLPNLLRWADKMIAIDNEILGKTKVSEDDHLGFMALCFLSKQINHMQSIVRLYAK